LDVPSNSFHGKGKPTAMKFSAGEGKMDFMIIPVHMKSNRGGVEKAEKQRVEEAKMIVDCLPAVSEKFATDNIIIIGDVNALHHSEEAVKIFLDKGFRDLNEQDLVTYISKKYTNSPLDRALVHSNQRAFSDSKMEVFKPANMTPEEFRQKLSDHYMIRFSVKVTP
jgi:predicted extracellular nuclease